MADRHTIILFSLTAWLGATGARAAAAPPLTDEQLTRLETAYDGRDHREEAFIALLENMRDWDGEQRNISVRLHPDIETMIEQPDRYRGNLVHLTGRVVQRTALPPPHEGVVECFLRDDAGRPLLVYVIAPDREADPLREGSRVDIVARFYKRVDFTARDGTRRSYAAFVGAHPRLITAAAGATGITSLAVLSIALLMMFIVFALLIAAIRRHRSTSPRAPARRLARDAIPPELDDTADLPDDPADALSELHRRITRASD